MFTPRSIIPMLLVGGLVIIEVLSGSPISNSVHSQRNLSQNETDLILSILRGETKAATTEDALPDFHFLDLDFPASPGSVSVDTRNSFSTVVGNPVQPTAPTPGYSDSQLAEVLPPLGSSLYYAYQDGGTAWYSESPNVLVIFPDETIQSFNSTTGEPNDWLQDRLARLPVSDASAYTTYQTTYKAKIVAETKSWVLMKFPSSGFLKVSKPQTTSTSPGSIIGLPAILPNYGP